MKKLSFIFIILAAMMWGVIGIFTRILAVAGLNSIQIVAVRSIFSAVIMCIFIFFKDKSLFKIKLKDIWMFIGTGVLSLTTFNFCYFNAINVLDLSIASVLLYTAPCFVMIMSAFVFKEKITKVKVLAFLIAFTGCALISSLNGEFNLKGVILGLFAGLGYALYSIFARIALEKYNTYTITLYTFITSALSLLPFCDVRGIMIASMDIAVLMWILLLAVISTVLPYILYTEGLKNISATNASIIAFAEPVTATVVGAVLFEEDITFIVCLGMLLVLASIIMISLKKS
ncbi:MAG: EamA family transporter [Clostridia bacterium]|nr:EamA family transporter [Clostridia bacterium]